MKNCIFVFAVIFAVLAVLWPRAKIQPLNVFDQPFYIGIAHDLLAQQEFTNGFFFQTGDLSQPRGPGMRFTPLYPMLLAGGARLDPQFRAGMACLVQTRADDAACPRGAPLERGVQFILLGLGYGLIWWMAGVVAGGRRAAWMALALALLTAPEMLGYVNYLMTETTTFFLFVAATAAALRGFSTRRVVWFCAAGLAAGLLALTKPGFFYVFLACAAVALAVASMQRRWRPAAGFALCGLVLPAIWIARNAVVLHHAALTAGYGPFVLNERAAFETMGWGQVRLSYLCWLPDGNGLGSLLYGPGACHRYQWDEYKDTFYHVSNNAFLQQNLAAAGGWPNMVHYLVATYIVSDPVKFAAVTLSFMLRGAYISHYWGLVLAPVCLVMTGLALRRRDWAFILVSLPSWFVLLLTAAISVDQTRYNLMLIAPFSIAGAMVLEKASGRLFAGRRRNAPCKN